MLASGYLFNSLDLSYSMTSWLMDSFLELDPSPVLSLLKGDKYFLVCSASPVMKSGTREVTGLSGCAEVGTAQHTSELGCSG